MQDEIKVKVTEYADRSHFLMQYRDPLTGRKKSRATKVERDGSKRSRTEAEREAGAWEKELRDGTYRPPSKLTWSEFRERYEDEVLASMSPNTDAKVCGVFNSIEKVLNPGKPSDLTASRLSIYQAKLRERGASENTIKGHLAHLASALNWAKRMGLLAVVPAIEMPRRAKGSKVMKGRPVAGEEFDRLLDAVSKVVVEPIREKAKNREQREAHNARVIKSWKHHLEGLWLSGLRLAESMELYWDRDDKLCVDLTGKRPVLRVRAELEKGNQDRQLPISPEFAEFLLRTPEAERTGPVFNPLAKRVKAPRLGTHRVSEIISAIGEKAGVKVNTDAQGKVKFASAHDLRRSFGERWASRVMPQVLMELMRHESIDTTMKFYVGRNAQTTADVLWAAHERAGNTSGNSDQNVSTSPEVTS